MATKEQVLPLLKLGLTPKQIAKKLKCNPAYVRATRLRALFPGYASNFPSQARSNEKAKRRYWSDEKHRERVKATERARARARRAEQSHAAN